MSLIQIKHRYTDAVLCEFEAVDIRDCLRQSVIGDADLRDADLGGADLRDADLRGADLRGADLSGANWPTRPARPRRWSGPSSGTACSIWANSSGPAGC